MSDELISQFGIQLNNIPELYHLLKDQTIVTLDEDDKYVGFLFKLYDQCGDHDRVKFKITTNNGSLMISEPFVKYHTILPFHHCPNIPSDPYAGMYSFGFNFIDTNQSYFPLTSITCDHEIDLVLIMIRDLQRYLSVPTVTIVESKPLMCIVCYNNVTHLHYMQCNHSLCIDCGKKWLKKNPSCPYCRGPQFF